MPDTSSGDHRRRDDNGGRAAAGMALCEGARHQDRAHGRSGMVPGDLAAGLLLLLALFASAPAFASGATLRLDDPGRVSRTLVTVDKSQTLKMDRSFTEALVANPAIADVVPLTDQSIYIVGKKVGMTRLTVLDSKKQLLGVIELEVGFDVNSLRQELESSVPGSQFRISTANGHILLGGSVADAAALSRAAEIAEQFAPKSWVNALTVRGSQQVLLEVRFVEAQRSAGRDLGFNWSVEAAHFTASPAIAGLPSGNVPFGQFLAAVLDNGTKADLLIEALEKRGLARRLAEPNLVTLSGDTANFLAGGEFPFPVVQSGNGINAAAISLEFKKFGVGLAFTPTVLADGQINLKIEPEVSDIDTTNSFSLGGGITVPGLVVRRANTTVELRDGQSFAIAGLLQTRHAKQHRQLPWIGNVPVLGALFRSASYENEESDLVIIVTPRLVRPAAPSQKLATPLDQKVASNDREFFLFGVHELPKQVPAPYGHILELKGAGTGRNELGKRDATPERNDGP